MTTASPQPLRVGELRPSQLLHTYGVGSVADLPNLSVMVMGLDHWNLENTKILTEDRLLAATKRRLGQQVQTLRTPPYVPETTDVYGPWARVGVPVTLFPRWLRCSDGRCNRLAPANSGLFELLPHTYSPEKIRYVHSCRGSGGSRPTAVPARFLIACAEGHLDDFPWSYFVHRGTEPVGEHTLKLQERGTTGEAANIFVTCSCESSRTMAEAIGMRGESELPGCRGRHPHLGIFQGCGQTVRTLALGATNSWFAAQLSVFSLPKAEEPLEQAVRDNWQMLSLLALVPADAALMLLPTQVCWPQLEAFGADEVWKAIRGEAARKSSQQSGIAEDTDELDLATPEWEAFTQRTRSSLPDFTTKPEPVPQDARSWLQQVVLVQRLREVAALTGFTRIDAPEWRPQDEDEADRLAPLAVEAPTWVPCAELRGEGVFLRFDEKRIAAWERLPEVRARENDLRVAYAQWCANRSVDPQWPGARYVLLHSFSHMLIREFALECGYGASGIGERIYARSGDNPMAGVLLYTAAPDSEGTLGGLVTLGQQARLGPLVSQALEAARLCSSDPLCAEHDPTVHSRLHGAACHACLFAAETSCEKGNHFLDRSMLVETLAGGMFGFFAS